MDPIVCTYCKYCGSDQLRCLSYWALRHEKFKARYRCKVCGRSYTVKWNKINSIDTEVGVNFAVVIDSAKLRDLCKYYFAEKGEHMCAKNSAVCKCNFQCGSVKNGNNIKGLREVNVSNL